MSDTMQECLKVIRREKMLLPLPYGSKNRFKLRYSKLHENLIWCTSESNNFSLSYQLTEPPNVAM